MPPAAHPPRRHRHARPQRIPACPNARLPVGTPAAAAGGITTLFESISKLAVNSGDSLAKRAALLGVTAVVDFALYGGAGHENLEAIAGQAEAGAIAFKTFLQPPPPTRLDEFFGLWCTDEVLLRDVMRAVKATSLRHCFHCEHTPTFQAFQRRLEQEGRITGKAHAESRPPGVEELSVAIVLALAEDLGARVQVVHCSSPRSARLARDARWRGVDATVETCRHISSSLTRPRPARAIREVQRRRSGANGVRGCQCLREGLIRWWARPLTVPGRDKATGAKHLLAPPGSPASRCRAAHAGGAHGWITLEDVAALCAENAAKLFALPRKGRLQAGADADLTIVDLGATWRYDSAGALTKSRANMRIYDGVEMHGRVVSVVRGAVVARRRGHGQPAGAVRAAGTA
jgi:dihydroorotase-like cyclic amidohydrolase